MTASAYHILRHTGCRVVFTRLADREGFDIAGKSGLYFHWGQKVSDCRSGDEHHRQ